MNLTTLQLVLEHVSLSVCAAGGVLAARGKRIDLFGLIVLALVTAFGGGTVRDVLAGDLPPVWLRTPDYLANGVASALLAFLLVRRFELPERAFLLVDAFALALFTMIGTRKAVSLGFSAPAAVLLGVSTGVAGGILRDVLLGQIPMVFRQEIRLYATAAMFGGMAFVLLHRLGAPVPAPTLGCIGTVLALRLAGMRWHWTLPVIEHQPAPGTTGAQPASSAPGRRGEERTRQ